MADDDQMFETPAAWRIDDVPPQQDRVPGQADRVPSPPSVSDASPTPKPWRRLARLTAHGVSALFVLATVTLGLVEPVRMWDHGWNSAQHLRGAGAGRGVFAVASCGPEQEDSNETKFWDCSGTFSKTGAEPVQATVNDYRHDHAGVTRRAYDEGDGSIGLADDGNAGALLAWWASLALGVFLAEVAVCFGMVGLLERMDEAAMTALGIAVFGGLVLAVLCVLAIPVLAITFTIVGS